MADEFYLKQDIVNSKTRIPYGVKGEKVKFISDHDTCYIVESERNIRFGVSTALLSKDKVERNVIIKTKTPKK